MTEQIVILSTCASESEAEALARTLLDRRLAACVNVLPRIRSFYHWKGAVEASEECMLLIKSSRPLFAEVAAAVEKAHSYELPEVVALPIVAGSVNYLTWLSSNLRPISGDES
jgi:periplasmic divalent cation tolerance protein